MSEGLIKTIVICVTVFASVLVASLAAIAILKGDGSESQIVTMMVGLPMLLITAGGPILATLLHMKLGGPQQPTA